MPCRGREGTSSSTGAAVEGTEEHTAPPTGVTSRSPLSRRTGGEATRIRTSCSTEGSTRCRFEGVRRGKFFL